MVGKDRLVALKKVLTESEKEGFPITALREIKILQVLNHENIVRLIEICTTKSNLFIDLIIIQSKIINFLIKQMRKTNIKVNFISYLSFVIMI